MSANGEYSGGGGLQFYCLLAPILCIYWKLIISLEVAHSAAGTKNTHVLRMSGQSLDILIIFNPTSPAAGLGPGWPSQQSYKVYLEIKTLHHDFVFNPHIIHHHHWQKPISDDFLIQIRPSPAINAENWYFVGKKWKMPSESSKALNNAKCLYTAKYNMQHVLCLYELQPGAASSDASILYLYQKYYLLLS